MTDINPPLPETVRAALFRPRSPRRMSSICSFIKRQPVGFVSALFMMVLVAVALVPGLITSSRYDEGVQFNALQSPSADHWMGTDHLGRDVFSRVIYGARTSVIIGFSVVVLASVTASVVAIVGATVRGWVDFGAQRLVDIWMTFPPLVFIIMIVSILGQSTTTVIIALALVSFSSQQRIVRSAALGVSSATYVEAAYAMGASRSRTMVRHVLPNVAPIIIIAATTSVGGIILAESALSFLGFGPPPPFPSWGRMLNDAQGYVRIAQYLVLFPIIAIAVTVYAANMFGDALRDHLDPRLKE